MKINNLINYGYVAPKTISNTYKAPVLQSGQVQNNAQSVSNSISFNGNVKNTAMSIVAGLAMLFSGVSAKAQKLGFVQNSLDPKEETIVVNFFHNKIDTLDRKFSINGINFYQSPKTGSVFYNTIDHPEVVYNSKLAKKTDTSVEFPHVMESRFLTKLDDSVVNELTSQNKSCSSSTTSVLAKEESFDERISSNACQIINW